jgi:hypothetical protein
MSSECESDSSHPDSLCDSDTDNKKESTNQKRAIRRRSRTIINKLQELVEKQPNVNICFMYSSKENESEIQYYSNGFFKDLTTNDQLRQLILNKLNQKRQLERNDRE